MLLTFLLVIQAIVAVLLVGVILMQQSEGGGLGMGGSPTGLMSARGAADFLTRSTMVLASVFIGLSILHAVIATHANAPGTIDTSLARHQAPTAPPAGAPAVPLAGGPTTAPTPVPAPQGSARPQLTVPLVAAPEPVRVVRPAERRAVERAAPKSTASQPVAPPPLVATTPATTTSGNSN